MYETYYNLRAEPFRLSPDHRFCYVHNGYAKARAYMAYAFMRAEGFVMITGRPGTGKTTLIGDLIESLAKDNVTTANLVCTQLQADDLLKTVAYSFGVGGSGDDKAELLQHLNTLFHNWHRDGRRALLIVDEAQDLSTTAMEELRLLTNIQVDGQPLLQIFLLGQPELRDLVLSPPMEQVHQRIVAASHLEALEPVETEEYVRHRLDAVGWRNDPSISKSIYPLIYKFSEGVPRRINLICSRLLLHGSVEQRHALGVADIRTVIGELQGENLAAGSKFSEDDFALDDEFESIVVEEEGAPADIAGEVHPHPVVSDSLDSAGVVPAADKCSSRITEVPELAVTDHGKSAELVENEAIQAAGSHCDVDPSESVERGEVNYPVPELEPQPEPDPEPEPEGEPQPGAESTDSAGAPEIPAASAEVPAEDPFAGRDQDSARKGLGRLSVLLFVTLALGAGYFWFAGYSWSELRAKSLTLANGLLHSSAGQAASPARSEPAFRADQATISGSPAEPGFIDPAPATEYQDAGPVGVSDLPAVETLVIKFAFDSADLSSVARNTLEGAVQMLRADEDSTASINGYSDRMGEEAYNLELSRWRANAVKQYLAEAGVESSRLRVEWPGARADLGTPGRNSAAPDVVSGRLVEVRINKTR